MGNNPRTLIQYKQQKHNEEITGESVCIGPAKIKAIWGQFLCSSFPPHWCTVMLCSQSIRRTSWFSCSSLLIGGTWASLQWTSPLLKMYFSTSPCCGCAALSNTGRKPSTELLALKKNELKISHSQIWLFLCLTILLFSFFSWWFQEHCNFKNTASKIHP